MIEEGAAAPHLPVAMATQRAEMDMTLGVPLGPRAIAAVPPIGCSRGVEDWAPALAKVREVSEVSQLPLAGDAVMSHEHA